MKLSLFRKFHINWPIAGTILALAVFFVLSGFFVYWQVGSLLGISSNSSQLDKFNFPKTYDKPLIIKLTDLAISIAPLKALPAQAQIEKNIVRYINAFTNTDIVQTKYTNKIKEDIILRSPGHPEIFEYQIDLTPYDFSKDSGGNLVFYEKGKSGDENYRRFSIPAPFLIDADGKKSSTQEVEFNLTNDGRLTLKPSAQWLGKAKYPVILDPTIEINILNVHSHPQQGENWTVDFTTQGTADLKIIPNDQATIDDDEFVSLTCGDKKFTPQILAGDVIFSPKWSCNGTGQIIHYTKKAGNHTLRFEFGLSADEAGRQTVYAYNSDTSPIIFRNAYALPADTYTKLLLHADGTNGSTTFTDSEATPKTVTVGGSAQISTAQSKFGGASAFLDGTGMLSLADSVDWNFGSGDFTVDFWFRPNAAALSGAKLLLSHEALGQYRNWFVATTNGVLGCYASTNGTSWDVSIVDSGSLTADTWYHLAFVRNGSNWKCYKGGSSVGTPVTNSSAISNWSEPLEIPDAYYLSSGYFDEMRVSKGIARWTSNFTPPIAAYGDTSNSQIVFRGGIATTGGTITYTDSSGLNPRSNPPYAGGYTVHTFISSGTFSVNGNGNVEVLVVAGGGGGGAGYANVWRGGGGGGAGGMCVHPGKTVTAGEYSIVVGAGGTAGEIDGTPDTDGGNGENSSFSDIISVGGGGGGGYGGNGNGADGGSGGGAAAYYSVGGSTTQGSSGGATCYGYAGHAATSDGEGGYYPGGGGGASGGAVGVWNTYGGPGRDNSISGSTVTYAAGGSYTGNASTANTGNGGNALYVGDSSNGYAGGSGIVIVRYRDRDTTPTGTTVTDGIAGKARSFNGSSDYIEVSAKTWGVTSNFTVSAWVYYTASSSFNYKVWGLGNGTNYNMDGKLYLYDNGSSQIHQLAFLFYGDSVGSSYKRVYSSNNAVKPNTWNHVVGVMNNNVPYVYVNGVDVSSSYDGGGVTLTDVSRKVWIGTDFSNDGKFNGKIDEVKFSNVVRTAEEIAEEYRMGRDHRIFRTISSTDLSAKSKIPFYVAADRVGTYLETTIGESAYANYEPDSNTVGFWHLDEQSGSGAYFKDSSDYRNHGSVGAGSPAFVQGKFGKARSFNGSSDYLTMGTNASLAFGSGSFSFGAWVKTSDAGNYKTIISKGASNSGAAYRYYNRIEATTGAFHASIADGANEQNISCGSGFADGQWHYAMTVVDRSSQLIINYIDGKSVCSASTSSVGNINSSQDFRVGVLGTMGYYFLGTIDEAIALNRALTASEIRQAYEIGKRTHAISIDFASAPSAADIIGASEDNAKTDTTFTLANDGMIENIFPGDKIIIKENYAGTEYILQGNVSSVTVGTRIITVDAWTGTVPPETSAVCGGSNTHCFSANATVFKWQREYMDPTGSLSTQRDAVTRLTLKMTDGNESRNVWLDDFKNTSNYLTAPAATSNVFSTANRYMQYRAILSSTDQNISPYLSSVTVNYTEIPLPPTGVSATDGTYTDKVVVSWDASTNATGYKVWNGSSWIDVGNVLTYDDTNAPAPTITPGTAVASDGTSTTYVALSLSGNSVSAGSVISYKVRAYNSGGESADSSSDNGNRGAGSLSYQWQRSAADSDASYSDITGGTTSSYNDTGAPIDGSGRYFKCVLSSPGAASATSTSNRGYVCGLPVVTTQSPTAILYSSATANGNITSIGLNNPTVRGFKYGLTEADTWNASENGSFSTGAYALPLTGLSARTGYSIRAYATNTCGTSYGSYVQFTTGINASPIEFKKNIDLRKNIELK